MFHQSKKWGKGLAGQVTAKEKTCDNIEYSVVLRIISYYIFFTQRLTVFENRVLRRIFGPKRDEVAGEWRRLHNEEFNDLYSSTNIARVVK
jgi:hypothetical protein